MVKGVSYEAGTGTFTITFYNDTTVTIDTIIEKIPASMALVDGGDTMYLRITNQDGSYTQADVTNLVDSYTFSDGNTIDFTANGFNVTAEVKDGSITDNKLASALVTTLEGYVTTANTAAATATTKASDASTSASNASASASTATQKATEASGSASSASTSATNAGNYANNAQSWAVGGTNSRDGEDTNNAKYWCEKAHDTSVADMRKAVYDTDNDGIVDNAKKFNGHEETYFAKASDLSSKADVGHTHIKSEITDFTHVHTSSDVSGLATVATSGSYTDLSNQPTIPIAVAVVNALDSDSTTAALSAAQGKELDTKKANKSTVYSVTLSTAWNEYIAPFTQNVTITEHNNTTDLVELMVGFGMVSSEIAALQAANIVRATWSDNTTLKLYAYGTKPNVDLPIKLVVRGDV